MTASSRAACPPGPTAGRPAAYRFRIRRTAYEPGRGGGRVAVPRVPAVPVPTLPEHPEARAAVGRVLRLAGEVLDGRRPESHLAGHTDAAVLRYWRAVTRMRRVAGPHRPAPPVRFGPIRLMHPTDGVAEVAVVAEVAGRPRALAARFDLADGQWRWTAARLG